MVKFIVNAGSVYVKNEKDFLIRVCSLENSGELLSVYERPINVLRQKGAKSQRLIFVRLPKKCSAKFLVFLTKVPRKFLEENQIELKTSLVGFDSQADECWLANKIELEEDYVRITASNGEPILFSADGEKIKSF
ncbi:MAG: hypothetical protein E7012_01500 [Alphaproteobacteria bacterium]|nr:hypothetical protein [Alphaproteobacteria bacterium]